MLSAVGLATSGVAQWIAYRYTSEIDKKCAGLLLLGVQYVSGIAALQGTHTHCKELQAHVLEDEQVVSTLQII